jgi:hypothetical protein
MKSDDVDLKAHFEAILAEKEKRYEQRFLAQEKSVEAAFASSETAKEVAEANWAKWQANANEWRKAMDDRERNFLSKGMGYIIGALAIVSGLLSIFREFT